MLAFILLPENYSNKEKYNIIRYSILSVFMYFRMVWGVPHSITVLEFIPGLLTQNHGSPYCDHSFHSAFVNNGFTQQHSLSLTHHTDTVFEHYVLQR